MNPGQPSPRTARLAQAVPILLVAAACGFNAVAYLSELLVAAPDINDDVFHFGLIQRMSAAWDAGGNPLDTWVGYWGQGFPVLRYYQHLPHLAVVLLHRLLGGEVSLHTVFDGVAWLLLALLPLSFYAGSRRLGAAPMTAACIALCVPLLDADPLQRHFLGFQAQSFLWSGGGLFTQLMAMTLFPIALGSVSRAALDGRRFAPAIAWLAATWLSHLLLGYTACLLGLVVLLRPESRGQRRRVALRLGVIYAGVAVVAAYLLLPTLLEGQWLARSMWEPPEYWHSYGARRVVTALATGGLLDGQRVPILTVLAAIGALLAGRAAVTRRADAETGFAIAALGMFLLGLMLFFGRPTWGRAIDLLPFSGSLPLHRFICAVQFGGLLLAGFALAEVANVMARLRVEVRTVVAGAVALLILSPATLSIFRSAQRNAAWRDDAAAADAAARAPFERVFADFHALEDAVPGRGYSGASWDRGDEFRFGGTSVYHRWSANDLPAIGYMYHTMGLSSDLEPSFQPGRRDHFELFNVRYLLADDATRLPAFTEARLSAAGIVSGLVATEGYFGIVGSAAFVRYEKGEASALRNLNRAFIASGWHAQDKFVRIGWRPGDVAVASERTIPPDHVADFARVPDVPTPRGTVISSGGRGDHYHARVELQDPGFILFRMTYHPNWKATLDGEPAQTEMLSPGYVAVRAARGEHVLDMEYRSPRWTRVLLWTGLLFLGLVAVADARRRRALDQPR